MVFDLQMSSKIMDQRRMSPSSFFYDEVTFPAQRQVGFWKPESMPEHNGMGILSPRGKAVGPSPLEGHLTTGAQLIGSLELSQPSLFKDQKSIVGLDQDVVESERNTLMSTWRYVNPSLRTRSNIYAQPATFTEGHKVAMNGAQHENSLFSSSLSDMFNNKLALSSNNVPSGQSADAVTSHFEDEEPFASLKEIEAQTIGNLLPDDDDLLAGVYDDLYPGLSDEMDEFDLFSSGGGMELGDDGSQKSQQGGQNGSLAGEHPYGEHPSRTLFVRNINSNVEDSELKLLFEDNPSDRDVNQGTLVVFNLESSVSNDELRQIFGSYGEIKEIRETPHKRHHKFIEFYDVRAAEAALRGLNRTDIAGKRIKLEPSRPGGARRSMQLFSPELELEESGVYQQQGSPPINSSPGGFESISHRAVTSSCMENGSIQGSNSTIGAPTSPFVENGFHHGTSSGVPHSLPSQMRVASLGSQPGLGDSIHNAVSQMKLGFQCMPNFHPHSLPEYHDGLGNGVPYNNTSAMASMSGNIGSGPSEGIDNMHIRRVSASGHSVELSDGVFGSSGNGSCFLHGNQYVWNNSGSYHPPQSPMMLPNSPSFVNGVHAHTQGQLHGLPRVPSQMINAGLPIHHHHVGSAPAINPSLWDKRHAYAGESPDASNFHPGSFGSMVLSGGSTLHPLGLPCHNIYPRVGGNTMDLSIGSPNIGLHSPQQRFHMFPGRNSVVPMPSSFDAPNERIRSRRSEAIPGQADNKKQFELDIERILHGEDSRTTLMIKNIPNKYTSKMLLAAIDERHRGTYDFIYLPIDFKNKCNVGYAFINMIDPLQIIPFYQAFNGKKWEKFNSEKVASLAYARIQGKAALITHFQNSSLMNEDKRCRPILFHSDGPNAGDQEPFPMGVNIRSRPGRSRTSMMNEESNQRSSSTSPNREEPSNEMDPSSLPAMDS